MQGSVPIYNKWNVYLLEEYNNYSNVEIATVTNLCSNICVAILIAVKLKKWQVLVMSVIALCIPPVTPQNK